MTIITGPRLWSWMWFCVIKRNLLSSTYPWGAASSSVLTYQTTWCHIPEDSNLCTTKTKSHLTWFSPVTEHVTILVFHELAAFWLGSKFIIILLCLLHKFTTLYLFITDWYIWHENCECFHFFYFLTLTTYSKSVHWLTSMITWFTVVHLSSSLTTVGTSYLSGAGNITWFQR
jgi:hypothetical protein